MSSPAELLRFSDITAPGITRKRLAKGWGYYFDGRRIVAQDEIDRLNALGVPPAYERCWFSPDPAGHIQAIGYDARGRRQYRYHANFRSDRDREKFDRCVQFGNALIPLRRRIDRDLGRRIYDKTTIVAAIVRLLDVARLRVGGVQYARDNGSFGATTLRKRHAQVRGQKLQLKFTAKSGKVADYLINDRVLARIVRRCQDLPGQELFVYRDGREGLRPVTSHDVNAYLKEATQGDFTAKDFRTEGASLIAYESLIGVRSASDAGPVSLKAMLAEVSTALGNTPAVARKAYIHPRLIEAAQSADLPILPKLRAMRHLSKTERGLISYLSQVRT